MYPAIGLGFAYGLGAISLPTTDSEKAIVKAVPGAQVRRSTRGANYSQGSTGLLLILVSAEALETSLKTVALRFD